MQRTRLLLALMLTTGGQGCHRKPDPPLDTGEPAVQVGLAPVRDTVLRLPVVVSGVLAAKEEIPLGFKIGGVIDRVLVDGGDAVAAGQTLATLQLSEIGGAVDRAEAGQRLAEQNLTRARELYRDSVVTRAALDQAESADAVARADLRVARFNQRYAVIRAPAAGTVQRRLAEPGQQISGGTPVLMLASARRGQVVRVGLSDRDVSRVRVGDSAQVRFDGVSRTVVAGRVSQIGAAADAASGTWPVEVTLGTRVGGAGEGLLSGLIGRVEIIPGRPDPVRLVPLASLIEGDGDTALVYVLVRPNAAAPGVARRRAVRVAFLAGDRAAISAGLDSVEQVIERGAPYLHDGAPVSVTARGPEAAP